MLLWVGVDPIMFLKFINSVVLKVLKALKQQAPITAATFANSGTSGMMSTDPIIVGSNGDNIFDLSSGAYSEVSVRIFA